MSVLAKLGLDTSEFSRGWNRAQTIAETGAAGIGKAVKSKLDLGNVFKSVVAAVGFGDLQKAANAIDEFFGIGEKQQEEWRQFGEESEKVADASIKNMRALASEEHKYQLNLQDRDRLLVKIANQQIRSGADLLAQKKLEYELSEKTVAIAEYEGRLREKAAEQEKRENARELGALLDLNEKKHDAALKNLKADERAKRLAEDVKALESAHAVGLYLGNSKERSEAILQKRRGDLLDAQNDIPQQMQADKEKAARLADLITRRDRRQMDVNERRSDLSNAVGDRGKLTLAELANIGSFQSGVSADASSQAGTAREVLDLQKKAEEARLGGRSEDAVALLGQADKLKGGLSALTSGERMDPFEAYKKALAESEQQLVDINKTLAGKFTNQ